MKRYIASALGRFGDTQLKPLFVYLLGVENDPAVRTGLLGGLYQLGESSVLEELLVPMKNNDYLVRAQAISVLLNSLREQDVPLVRKAIAMRGKREKHRAVCELLDSLEDQIATLL